MNNQPDAANAANALLSRFDSIIRELEQLIRDAEYWNGLPHNQRHTPLDVEADRVLLARVRADRARFLRSLGFDLP